jgi:hypothetical protein
MVLDAGPAWSTVTQVAVSIAGQTQVVDVSPECLPGTQAKHCLNVVTVPVPPTLTDRALVTVNAVDTRNGAVGARPIRLDEILVNGVPNPRLDLARQLGGCSDLGLQVDGQPVAMTLDGTLGNLLAGRRVPFRSCSDVSLGPGWHSFDGGTSLPEGSTTVTAVDGRTRSQSTAGRAGQVRMLEASGTKLSARVVVPAGGTTLVVNRSFEPGWKATIDGADLGSPESVDAQIAWRLTRPGTHVVEVEFTSQHKYLLALLITCIALLACIVLVIVGPTRRKSTRSPVKQRLERTGRARAVTSGAVVFLAFLAAGIPGVFVAGSALAACRLRSPRFVAIAAMVVLGVAAVATLVEGTLALGPGFASDRPVASWAGVVAGVLLLVAVTEFAWLERVPKQATQTEQVS